MAEALSDAPAAAAPAPNPAVVSVLRSASSHPGTTTESSPGDLATSPTAARQGLSMHPEAVRARARRAARSGRPASRSTSATATSPATPPARTTFARTSPAAGDQRRLTPEQLRAEISSLPAPAVVATPEQVKAASNFVSMAIRAAGWVAAAVFKSDDMKVPETDAQETARLIVDGWPELATSDTADAKKTLAVMAVGSLVAERYGKYQRRGAPPVTAAPAPAPAAPETGRLPHQVISA